MWMFSDDLPAPAAATRRSTGPSLENLTFSVVFLEGLRGARDGFCKQGCCPLVSRICSKGPHSCKGKGQSRVALVICTSFVCIIIVVPLGPPALDMVVGIVSWKFARPCMREHCALQKFHSCKALSFSSTVNQLHAWLRGPVGIADFTATCLKRHVSCNPQQGIMYTTAASMCGCRAECPKSSLRCAWN